MNQKPETQYYIRMLSVALLVIAFDFIYFLFHQSFEIFLSLVLVKTLVFGILNFLGAWRIFKPVALFLKNQESEQLCIQRVNRLAIHSSAWIFFLGMIYLGISLTAIIFPGLFLFKNNEVFSFDQIPFRYIFIDVLPGIFYVYGVLPAFIGYYLVRDYVYDLKQTLDENYKLSFHSFHNGIMGMIISIFLVLIIIPSLLIILELTVALEMEGIYSNFTRLKPVETVLINRGAVFTGMIISIFLISRVLIKPLNLLLSNIQKLKTGDLSIHSPVISNDEIGRLTHEFNELIRELQFRQERLLQQEKKAIIGDLSAGLVHEVKNQLTPITFLELCEDEVSDETRNYYSLILSGRDRIIDLIDEVRALARNEDVKYLKKKENPGLIVQEAVSLVKMDKTLKPVSIEINDDFQSTIEVNKNKLIQVLLNLLRNSAQALENRDGGKIEINLVGRNGNAEIEICDNGCGISENKLQNIWLPFYSTKGEEGTGIGLDVCKKIIEGHGGTILCRSVVNEGTVFTIAFPLPQ